MNGEEELRDQHLLQEVSRITNEYGVLHRDAVRDLARIPCRALTGAQRARGRRPRLRAPLTTIRGFNQLLLDDQELAPSNAGSVSGWTTPLEPGPRSPRSSSTP